MKCFESNEGPTRPLLLMLALSLAACTSSTEPEPVEEPQDAENEQFVQNGKADTNGVEDHGYDAQCVVNLANRATEDELDDDVGLYGRSASEMVDRRPFHDLEGVDAVSWVGWFSFRRMLSYAQKEGYCPQLAEEHAPPGEDEAAQRALSSVENELDRLYPEGETMLRDAHPKGHGCVKAHVAVDNDELPEEMRVGAFAEDGREYEAWIRFSNSDVDINHDKRGDARGMALKLIGVDGEKLVFPESNNMDIIMINHPVFAVRNALDMADFLEAGEGGNMLSILFDVVLDLDPREIKIREMLIILDLLKTKIANPLFAQYHSMVPYLLGENAVKYTAIPCENPDLPIPSGPEDFLRQAMQQKLGEDDACFTLAVQRQIDPEEMPIEDPTLEWDEEDSPFIKVADIRVPAQTFDTPEQNEFCENLSFNPWRVPAEHRPLGGINRIRKVVYEAISKKRHDHNDAPMIEPDGHEDQF